MAIAGTLKYDTKLDTKDYQDGLNKISASTIAKGQLMADAFKMVASKIIDVVKGGIEYNATIENLTTSFEVMTGSAGEATKLVEKLKKAGAETPYELAGLAQTTQILMQYGLTADEAYNSTMNFGDIAQGSAEKMQSIALAYGQMSSAGKVNMQDIKQMINAGFNPLQAIVEMTGKSMAQVTQEYEDGKISVDDITKAMAYASGANGKYYKSMEKQSKTLNGQLSTLQDNFKSLSGLIANDTTNAITGSLLPAINFLLSDLQTSFSEEGFAGMADTMLNWITEMAARIAEQAPAFVSSFIEIITKSLNTLLEYLPFFLQSGIDILMALINGLIQAIPILIPTIYSVLSKMIDVIIENLPMIIDAGITLMFALIDGLLNNIDKLVDAGIKLIIAVAFGLIEALPKLIDKIPEIIEKLITAIINNLPKIIEAGIKITLAIAWGLIQAIPQLISKVPQIIWAIVNRLGNLIYEFVKIGGNIVSGIWNGISNGLQWIKNKISGWVGNVLDFFKRLLGIASPSKVMRDEIGKFIPQGVAVGITANTDSALDSIDTMNDEMMNKMKQAVNVETGKSSFSGISGSVSQILSSNATFDGNFVVEAKVDEGVLFEANERITSVKNLQTQFGK